MQIVLEKLKEIETGDVGIVIFSHDKQSIIGSLNKELIVPLASAGKVVIAFCIAKLVEEGRYRWDDLVDNVSFNPNEDSSEIYPHFQNIGTLALKDAVEVMIACHDSVVANRIVQFCGGWNKIDKQIKLYFTEINITQNPRDIENKGVLSQVMKLLCQIFEGYKNNPELWKPIVNGLVRQRGDIEGIPSHHLNHMTGGLDHVAVDIGIIGEFSTNPFLYVLGAKDLPNRLKDKSADDIITEALKLLYEGYLNSRY